MAGAVLAGTTSRFAFASSRPARGGKVAMRVPFAVKSVDPHALDDVGSMLFGAALFEGLYRLVPGPPLGFEPVLAETLPTVQGGVVSVPLRRGLVSARGRALQPRQVVDAIERSRRGAGRFVLHGIPRPKATAQGIDFASKDLDRVLLALASPLVAMTGPSFAPTAPDGTGAFVAGHAGDDTWTLHRNGHAASGAALLDSLQMRRASSLSDSLRAFEAGDDQLAWHGLGLHDPRPGARSFDAGAVGALVLAVGKEAGPLDVPGVAQQLCDGLTPQRLAHLNLGPAWQSTGDGWTGAPTTLLVTDDSPYLRELAETVAVSLSRPGHEITARPAPAAEVRERMRTRSHALALSVVRPLWPTPLGIYGALLAVSDPEHAPASLARPPKVQNVRSLARSLRVGLLGELRLQGGAVGDLVVSTDAPGELAWGNLYYARRRK